MSDRRLTGRAAAMRRFDWPWLLTTRLLRDFAAGTCAATFVALLVLVAIGVVAPEARADGGRTHTVVGSWSTGHMTPLPSGVVQYSNQTLREIVRTSIGGDRVRVRIANTFGGATLHIGALHPLTFRLAQLS
jgi:hypothetical protein